VMAERGRQILLDRDHAPAEKIVVVPHGAPDCPLIDPNKIKPRFDYMVGRQVMLTFGLLSPNKGIESVIRAMPDIVAARPDTLYVVLGATHPHLLRREGETYREGLQKLAEDLGVGDHVRFVNTYVGFEELIAFLSAADIYVTPYLNEAQITSGTLSYAVALGKPVVSTPYWHAAELLSDDVGVLVNFNDSAAFSCALIDLLSDEAKREACRARAYAKGRETIWARSNARYMQTFETAAHETPKAIERRRAAAFTPTLRGVDRLTDNCGILQHARFSIPDRAHGYCVDDNARALILMQRGRNAGLRGAQTDRLSAIYASFVDHAWNEGHGRFRNFMSYGRAWLEEAGSEDSFGRALWSLGETAALAQDVELRDWAIALGAKVTPHVESLGPLRSHAFSILGLAGLPQEEARKQLRRSADLLANALREERKSGWVWFEPALSYDNARLPEALITAGRVLRDQALADAGVDALSWLTTIQTAPSGVFRPVGNESFGKPYCGPTQFDQQALEAVATVDACWAAFDATGDAAWAEEAQRAYAWYFGRNEMGIRMITPDGAGCYDGIGRNGINRNQGAESVLSLQLANCAMKTRERGRKHSAAC
jgi:Glycosyl transferases group 1